MLEMRLSFALYALFTLTIHNCLSQGIVTGDHAENCEYFMVINSIVGRGIYSGKDYYPDDVVENHPSLTIKNEIMRDWSLNNFVYGTFDPDRSEVSFGIAMLLNHGDPNNVGHFYSSEAVVSGIEQNSSAQSSATHTQTKVVNSIVNNIPKGSELLSTYGHSDWFSSRNVELNDLATNGPKMDVNDLKEKGICMSHVYVQPSKLPLGGNGLFSKKKFSKGDTIYVSPVLVLPKREVVREFHDTVLLNYCVFPPSSKSDIALLPIGLAAMANHGRAGVANMAIKWFDDSFLSLDPYDYLWFSYSPFDFEYYALRDIDEHEELMIDYGDEWVETYLRFVSYRVEYMEHNKSVDFKFRFPISPPEGLFPKEWESITCFGAKCEHENRAESVNQSSASEVAVNF